MMKEHKDKLSPVKGNTSIGNNNSITNNVVVADRNELLRMFAEEK